MTSLPSQYFSWGEIAPSCPLNAAYVLGDAAEHPNLTNRRQQRWY